jgi:quercetin dioxygenase-like cupin family protein
MFTGCALCALPGFAATGAVAEQPTPASSGVSRKLLQQTDGPAEGYVTFLYETIFAPNHVVPLHTHPGVESSYCVEGGGVFVIRGAPDRVITPGLSFQAAPYLVHGLHNGPASTKLASTYILEKGKPLSTPA